MTESKIEIKIKEVVGLAIGEASLQWIPHPTGVFDSSSACALVDRITCDILNVIAEYKENPSKILISGNVEHLVPDPIKNLKDGDYLITKIESFRPQSQVHVGDRLVGSLRVVERDGLPCVMVEHRNSYSKYIRTSPVIEAWITIFDNKVRFKTEGGIYELERLDK